MNSDVKSNKLKLKDYENYLAAVYRLFYHKNALSIVHALANKEQSQAELEVGLDLAKGTASRHVNNLLAADLVERNPQTRMLSLSTFGNILLEDYQEYAKVLYEKQACVANGKRFLGRV